MMVIRGSVPTNTFGTNGSGDVFHLPADRCSWEQAPAAGGRGYRITAAYLIGGANGQSAPLSIINPALGYIGKSGRFVEIAD